MKIRKDVESLIRIANELDNNNEIELADKLTKIAENLQMVKTAVFTDTQNQLLYDAIYRATGGNPNNAQACIEHEAEIYDLVDRIARWKHKEDYAEAAKTQFNKAINYYKMMLAKRQSKQQ
jgi:CRISPR/Cas system Type II protein with McrA/HNH and RuvC-like nuclease domain